MNMANNLFDLLGIDLDNLYQRFMNLQNTILDKYNELVKNAKKYDLDTDEGYENFIKDAAEVRKDLENSDSVFAQKIIELLDKAVKKAMENHESKKVKSKNLAQELVNTEVNRSVKENHGKVNKEESEEVPMCGCEKCKGGIDWPSDHISYNQAKTIWGLVDEYIETKVKPYADWDEDSLDAMSDGLFEFAAWVINK